jgi:hypothetical protein
MQGIVRFSNIRAAIDAGYQVCGRNGEGYLVRTMTTRGWALAIALAQ